MPSDRSANSSAPALSIDAPEWKLLTAACSVQSGFAAFKAYFSTLPASLDWDSILHNANDHGISALLYQRLSQLAGVPSPVLQALAQRYETNLHKSLLLTRELFRVLDCLESLAAPAIPYKGVTLSEIYYGDMALRQSGDMDFFVRAADVARIKAAVHPLGYIPRIAVPPEAEPAYIASGYECSFDSPAGTNLLELKWALQPRFYAIDYDMQAAFDRATAAQFAGRKIQTPSPEDYFLVLSLHAAKHVWGRLIWLCDIDRLLRRHELNWDWLVDYSRQLGVQRIVGVTLLLSNKFLQTEIPDILQESLASDAKAQAFAEQIASAVAAGTTYEDQQISYFRLMMRLRERASDRLRFASRLAFTPGPGEWNTLQLPRTLSPLYRIVRMGRLLGRLSRTVDR
ncbi:MAG TPA: nucleotidyltransferase family protein [Candidatus Binatia bacterium]|nr:nucleotidyltransferase family protein [Candidatus Binatia bacterium]